MYPSMQKELEKWPFFFSFYFHWMLNCNWPSEGISTLLPQQDGSTPAEGLTADKYRQTQVSVDRQLGQVIRRHEWSFMCIGSLTLPTDPEHVCTEIFIVLHSIMLRPIEIILLVLGTLPMKSYLWYLKRYPRYELNGKYAINLFRLL